MDPFATLGVPRTFDLELAAVERTHRELSRALHPDKYVTAPPSERQAALSRAVEVNEAWRVLRDPVRRAEALFALAGVKTGEDREPKADPEFLMEVLEKREALAEARAHKDAAAVRALATEMEARQDAALRELSQGFAGGGDLSPLLPKLGELRFYRRFLDEVSATEDEIT
jgi:molecular chaperone HscB